MSFLILPMFILLVVLAGLSLDIYIEETHREDLQDALDRGVLAAGAPHQDIDCEQVVWSYINSRTYNEKQAKADIDCDRQATFARVTAGSGFDMDTIIFSLLYTYQLPIIASSEAFEGEEKVEISLVLDISGSMARETSIGETQKRLEILRGAAKNFITILLSQANAERISVSLVPYAGQVNAGVLYDTFVSQHLYTYPGGNRCVDFTDTDFSSAALPTAGSLAQTPQFQNFRYEKDYGHEANWGWCPGNDQRIRPFSNSITYLHQAIDDFMGHDGTGTNNAVKWGLGLLDPSIAPTLTALHLDPTNGFTMPADFIGRPAPYTDARTKKYLIVMTDGNIRYQPRPTQEALGPPSGSECPDKWDAGGWGNDAQYNCYGYTYTTARNTLSRFKGESTLPTNTSRSNDEILRSQQFLDVCGKAKENGVVVYTIGFDISTTSDAYTEMQTCASSPLLFFDVDGQDLYDAFEQILGDIAKLQLTR